MKKAFLLFGTVVLIAACDGLKSANESSTNKSFEAQEITFSSLQLKLNTLTENEKVVSTGDVSITLNIDLEQGQYSGKSGCNSFFGTVESTDSTLNFKPGGMTEMLCAQDIMEWEALFMNTLTQNEYSVNVSNKFVLLNSQYSGVLLSFVPQEGEE